MTHISKDYAEQVHTAFTGTGEYTDAGGTVPTTMRSFASQLATGDTAYFAAQGEDSSGNAVEGREVFLGTKTSTGIARTTVLQSTNANAAVSWATAASVRVSLTATAQRLPQFDNQLAVVEPIITVASVSAALAGTIKRFVRQIAGRPMPKWLGPSGVEQFLQDALWDNGGFLYLPNSGSTVGLSLGALWAASGTVSHPTPALTAPAKVNQMYRTRCANVVTTTNQILGISAIAAGQARLWLGNAAGLGGFFFHCRFIVELWPAATVRLFVGLTDQATSPVAADALVGNCVGLWHDTTEAATVLNIVRRDGTTATKTAIALTGALAAGQAFDFYMWAAPNGALIGYRLDDINAGTTLVESSINTNLPASTAFMAPVAQMSNGTANITVTTTAIGVARLYGQSDF